MAEERKDIKVLRRVLAYVKPYRLEFLGALLLTILNAAIGPVRPLIIGEMVRTFIVGEDTWMRSWTEDAYTSGNQEGFLFWTMIVIGSLVLEGLVQFSRQYVANWLGQTIIQDIRIKLFRKITTFNLRYFDRTPVGSLVTRCVSDIEAISEIFSQGILTISSELLKVGIVIVLMFNISWKLSLLCLAPVPIMFFATKIFAKAMKNAFQQERTQVNKLNTFVQEHLQGMSIIQLFNRENEEYDKFKKINADHRQAHINAVWAFSIFLPFVELLSALALAIMIAYGVASYDAESDTIGSTFSMIFQFTLWIFMLFRPIRQLAERFNTLQRGIVRAERVFDVMDKEALIEDVGSIEHTEVKGEIEFKNVSFAYVDDDYVLNDVSFKVEPGQTVAFVGATGAGKTTIINLLSRFYEYQKGEILIDGINIRDYRLQNLRSHVVYVPQDVFLFSDSILNNITLSNDNISREQVIEAAKAVEAHHFIDRLPGGYDFNVQERGGMLSVGQRQLLSFIRAYVFDPNILVLDEATSSIDTESERLIQKATEKVTEGRTSVIIAHRLSTIQNADCIYVMEKGRIIEKGTHVELLQQGGQYARLYDLQFS